MRKLFRIAGQKHVDDLIGTGSRLYGGRWNEKGVSLVYTSESRALAALEYLVHVPMTLAPKDLCIIQLDIPDDIKFEIVQSSKIPPNWKSYPAPQELMAIGTEWVRSNRTLLLRVQSAVVSREYNMLINPAHPDFKRIEPQQPEHFAFDPRLLV